LRIVDAGDRAMYVVLGDAISPEINDRVVALATRLAEEGLDGVIELIPAYTNLLVLYDPRRLPGRELEERIRREVAALGESPEPERRDVEVPVCYGGSYGPDLSEVARMLDLTTDRVVELHSSAAYRVYCLGFTPGFPYMGGLPEGLAVPRLDEPKTRIPRGSGGIGGSQTGIYSVDSPGGWRVIGRTPLELFKPHASPPALFHAGDSVRFRPVSEQEFERLRRKEASAAPEAPSFDVGEPTLEVLDGGVFATVQDLGRWGYQRFGVTTAGALDEFALRWGNRLVGNEEGAAGIEVTLAGTAFQALRRCVVAVTGGDLGCTRGSDRFPLWTAVVLSPGDELRFVGPPSGCRAYLTVAGGVAVPPVMGSRSTDTVARFGGFDGRRLQEGDVVRAFDDARAGLEGRELAPWMTPRYEGEVELRATRGPQADTFREESVQAFFGAIPYRVDHRSDRMGCRLEGRRLEHLDGADIVSEGIPPGAVQVPRHGQPIIMLANRQTVGGYAKIANVIAADLWKLGQVKPGDVVRFREVAPDTARLLYELYERNFREEHVISGRG